jgi:hypothetical protein
LFVYEVVFIPAGEHRIGYCRPGYLAFADANNLICMLHMERKPFKLTIVTYASRKMLCKR